MSKPVVALFRINFLPYSETFIFDSLCSYKSFKPIVVAKKRINQDLFAFDPVYLLPVQTQNNRLNRYLFSREKAHNVMQRIANHQPKIAHAHFCQSGVFAMPFAQKLKIPLIVTLHGNDVGILLGRQKFYPKWWYYTQNYPSLIRNATLFLAASADLKNRFIELGCPPEKIRVYRLGINLGKFQITHNRQNKNSKLTILMVGRLVEKKGHFYGIQAFASAMKQSDDYNVPDAKLLIIGEGKLENELKILVRKIGLSDHTIFLGKQSHKCVMKYIQNATILMCPSVVSRNQDRDSGLIVAKEAAACGIPMIGTEHGGIPEIIEDDETGYLVPERDIGGLAKSLKKLLSNPELRKKFGNAARIKMEKEYNIKDRMAELESIYLETIQHFKHN